MKPRILFRASDETDHDWFSRMTSYAPGPTFKGIVAYDERGVGMGMVGMDSWTPNSVSMHWAIRYPRCILPLWDEVLDYLSTYGRTQIIGVTQSDNTRSLRMQERLGWEHLYVVEKGWDDETDLVVMRYRIQEKNSAKLEQPAAVRSAAAA